MPRPSKVYSVPSAASVHERIVFVPGPAEGAMVPAFSVTCLPAKRSTSCCTGTGTPSWPVAAVRRMSAATAVAASEAVGLVTTEAVGLDTAAGGDEHPLADITSTNTSDNTMMTRIPAPPEAVPAQEYTAAPRHGGPRDDGRSYRAASTIARKMSSTSPATSAIPASG